MILFESAKTNEALGAGTVFATTKFLKNSNAESNGGLLATTCLCNFCAIVKKVRSLSSDNPHSEPNRKIQMYKSNSMDDLAFVW